MSEFILNLATRLRDHASILRGGTLHGGRDLRGAALMEDAADLAERVEEVKATTWDDEGELHDTFDLTYDMEFDAFRLGFKAAVAALTGEDDQ